MPEGSFCQNCGRPVPSGVRFCGNCGSPVSPLVPPAGTGGPAPGLPPRYQVLRFLGRGGMGRVYLCRDTELDVEVAVKVLPPELSQDAEALEQIRREARAAARFRDCPGILSLYGFQEYGETRLLEMEYAAGGSLHDRLKREGALPEPEVRRIGAEVADALSFAHDRGVLHRDIKPANILLDARGRTRVADFGIARILSQASSRMSLVTVAGTPIYMAPEILLQQKVDGRADLYSLGCMLYELSTGERPFTGTYPEVAMAKTAPGAPVPDPRRVKPALSEDFAAAVRRLLAREPEDRFPDGAAAAAALRGGVPAPESTGSGTVTGSGTLTGVPPPGTAGGTVPLAPPPPPAAAPAGGGTRRFPAWAMALLGVVVLAAGAALLLPGDGKEWKGENGSGESPPGTAGGEAPPSPSPAPAAAPASAPAPRPGLLVRTDPPGARVSVDGVERGIADGEGLLLADLDPAVPHLVKAWLRDHDPAEEKGVTWAAGSRKEIRLVLSRLTGFLRLEGGPPGAAVEISGAAGGDLRTSLAGDGSLGPLPTGVGRVAARVTAPGFDPWDGEAVVEAGRTSVLRAALRERDGTLAVDTEPAGAEVHLGGSLLGTTPLPPTRVPAGRHALRLLHPDREEVRREVEVRGEKAIDLGTLPLPDLAVLDLAGLGGGVEARLDGRPVEGRLRLPAGRVEVVLRRTGHRPQTVTVELRSGESAAPSAGPWIPSTGRLDLSALPADVEVRVDGEPVDRSAGPLEREPGEHRVSFTRPGHDPVADAIVVVEADATATVPEPRWVRRVTVTPAVPGLPPPPEAVLAAQATLSLPEGLVRTPDRRIWSVKDGAELVLVPAGTFSMGNEGEASDERPVHRVRLSAFLVDRTEVTVAQYRAFCRETGRAMPRLKPTSADLHPVTDVRWEDAAAYLAWAGRRLPTEAEWERAARGEDGRRFPWGNEDEPSRRNGAGDADGFAELSPVGSFPSGASPYGCLDMSGNAWEWCSDWYGDDYYAVSAEADPQGPARGTVRVLRGGSWINASHYLRTGLRYRLVPPGRTDTFGFRGAAGVP